MWEIMLMHEEDTFNRTTLANFIKLIAEPLKSCLNRGILLKERLLCAKGVI